jgi:hypothetical protein
MINFTTESGNKVSIDPDDILAVSSCLRKPGQIEIALLDGRKINVIGNVLDVFTELEKDADDEDA